MRSLGLLVLLLAVGCGGPEVPEPEADRCGVLGAPCCLGPEMPTPGVCVGELRCVVLDRSGYGMPSGTCIK